MGRVHQGLLFGVWLLSGASVLGWGTNDREVPSSGAHVAERPARVEQPYRTLPAHKEAVFMRVEGDTFMCRGKPVDLVAYTVWSLANHTKETIDRALKIIAAQGYNTVLVRTSFSGPRNRNLDHLLREARRHGMWVGVGFGLYEFSPTDWASPRSKHDAKEASFQAEKFARHYALHDNLAFLMADAMDTTLPDRREVVDGLLEGFHHGAPHLLRTVHPPHGASSIGFDVDFHVLHSGHSQGRAPVHVEQLYQAVRTQHAGVVFNVEPLYYGDHPLNDSHTDADHLTQITNVDARLGAGVTFGDFDVVVTHGDWEKRLRSEGSEAVAAIGQRLADYSRHLR